MAGRKKTLIVSEFIFGIMMIVHGLSTSLVEMIIVRFILGVLFALIDTTGNPIVCEIVPASVRGTTLSFLMVTFILGVFLNAIGCYAFWEDVDRGNWRILFYIAGGISIFGSVLSTLVLRESPRYLMAI